MSPTTPAGATSASETSPLNMPNPTPEELASPQFQAIWQVIKSWDVNVPEAYGGYCGASGSHVTAILRALSSSYPPVDRWDLKEMADAVFAISIAAPTKDQIDRAYTAAEKLLSYLNPAVASQPPAQPPAVVPESVRRLSAAATQGEWQAGRNGAFCGLYSDDAIGSVIGRFNGFFYWKRPEVEQDANAALAAVAVNFVRTLLSDAPPSVRADEGGEAVQVQRVSLADCPAGLFLASGGALCLKTEYGDYQGRIDSYIVENGEFFWGGAKSIGEQRRVMVTPVPLEQIADAIHLPFKVTAPAPLASAGDVDAREQAAALCDEAAAYFDRTTGHYDRAQAAKSYRATAAKIRATAPAAPEPAAGGDAPTGWKLVPVEPTAAQMMAARIHHAVPTADEDHRRSIYRAMVSVAPPPPATRADAEGSR